ncbi:hypothetical protein MAPG_11497 [Magnaporthiopsis poae ATCC 64411]|uniref:Uncharacterized protein n=1 Tax=Magnaporthiopsis poae (strain ATCC 64411 / 73-15) TaxID=644358 RepID=A0A0C4EFF3_MAGP6|nr:hypothetical protein MAPG_11497 [Magnaporthiopsis poae ATCC 64411]
MSLFGRIVKASLALANTYAPFRDGLDMVRADATAAYDHINSSSSRTLRLSTSARIQGFFSATIILAEVVKIYQNEQIRRELKGLYEQLRMHNNLVAGGASGPDGFARQVLDFLDLKVREYAQDGGEHLFFIYHPDTNWHGEFARIAAEAAQQQPGGDSGAGEAQSRLLGVSHDLFAIFRLMLCTRVALQKARGDAATGVSFHLLVPSYSVVAIPRSFVAIDALFPLTIEGQIAQGEPLVWLNFPPMEGYNRPTLKDVGNPADLPGEISWEGPAIVGAEIATAAVAWMGITPLVVNAALAACPMLGVPALVMSMVGSAGAMRAAGNAVESRWEQKQPPPAILGQTTYSPEWAADIVGFLVGR